MPKSRDKRIDSIKGTLIILVILGHIIGVFDPTPEDDKFTFSVWNLIYLVHMPLFILICGYFSRTDENALNFQTKIRNLLIPLVIFQIINVVRYYLVSGTINILSTLLVPFWTLWFLLSLILWKIILRFTPRWLLNKPLLYLGIAIFFSLISGLMEKGKILSIQRTINFFPFFLLGYYLRNQYDIRRFWKSKYTVITILLCLSYITLELYPKNIQDLVRGAYHYSITDIPNKSIVLILSLLSSLAILYSYKIIPYLDHFGKLSLFYYLYHGLVIKLILSPLESRFNIPSSFPFIIIYTTLVIIILFIMTKIRFLHWLINPITKNELAKSENY